MNLTTQVLPVLAMIATILIIRRNVDLDLVPGFDKISGLILIIATLMCLMWIIDKTRIYSITFMPFYVVILILLAGFFVIRLGLKKLTG
jgi:amino acid transporter